MARWDLYEVLGVPRDAPLTVIKSAFRRKAKNAHPDLGGDPEEFQTLKLAYDILSDPESRRLYDETGELPEDREVAHVEEARFRTLVGDLLIAIVTQAGAPEFTDILRETIDAVGRQIEAVDHQMVTQSHLSARIGEILLRLHGPEEDDLVTALLREKLTEIEKRLKLARALKRRLAKLQQSLGQYRYDVQIETIL